MHTRVYSVDEFIRTITDLTSLYTTTSLKVVKTTPKKNISCWLHGVRQRGCRWITIVGCNRMGEEYGLDCTLDILELEPYETLCNLLTDCIHELGWRVP